MTGLSVMASPSRRTVLKGLGATGVTMVGSPLASSSIASAQSAGDNRSLVCIFLFGGADSFNLFVPRDHREAGQDHATYRSTRGSFAIDAGSLLGVDDGAFGLHPGLGALADIAESGRLATVMNVGPLVRPTTPADVSNLADLPQLLFSHNSQQKLWQTGQQVVASNDGWGGAIATAGADPAVGLSPAFSINGSVPWLSSRSTRYTRLSSTVSVRPLLGYDYRLRDWIPSFEGLQGVMETGLASASASASPLTQAASDTMRSSVNATEILEDITNETDVGMEDVSARSLGGRLRTVAQLISHRESLGMARQVFFVGMGGWDTHGGQAERFPVLLDELNEAIGAFQTSIDDMGLSDSVTSFTTSDFGRTLTSNGDGTDHGWGGHSFVWGGAVNPGRFGTHPSLARTNNPDDVSERGNFAGRIIPTTSVTQYGATLAGWMGLDDAQIDAAFPDLANFSVRDLGFL